MGFDQEAQLLCAHIIAVFFALAQGKLQFFQLSPLGSMQSHTSRQCILHGSGNSQIGWRSAALKTCSAQARALGLRQFAPLQIRQFEIFQKKAQKFIGRKRDLKLILTAVALSRSDTGSLAFARAATARARNAIAFQKFSVAGQNATMHALTPGPEGRLINPARRNDDSATLAHVTDRARSGHIPHGLAQDCARTPQESLPVRQAFA
jgi:hypothetical protein